MVFAPSVNFNTSSAPTRRRPCTLEMLAGQAQAKGLGGSCLLGLVILFFSGCAVILVLVGPV
jgi:hypothetical protein